LKKIVLTSHDDDFFKMNMYKNFGDIGILIKKLVGEFQEHMQNQKRIDSITDIKDFISSYPEFKKMSGTVSKHVSLLSELSRLVSAHSLLQVSEAEQNLCCDSGGRVEVAAIRELLHLPGLRLIDAKRLLCLLNVRLGSRECTMEERDLVNSTAKSKHAIYLFFPGNYEPFYICYFVDQIGNEPDKWVLILNFRVRRGLCVFLLANQQLPQGVRVQE
jgi:hypothetical protein